jgi:hypothetical protein
LFDWFGGAAACADQEECACSYRLVEHPKSLSYNIEAVVLFASWQYHQHSKNENPSKLKRQEYGWYCTTAATPRQQEGRIIGSSY